jgi:hypothetical protein
MLRQLGIVLISLLVALPASAVLIDLGTVTRDTDGGFDWLDVTETSGLSVNDILGGSGGLVADGWRFATATELCLLLATHAFAPSPCPGDSSIATDQNAALISLLGVNSSDASRLSSRGWYDDQNAADPDYGLAQIDILSGTTSRSDLSNDSVPLDAVLNNTGAFLVRPIPEPSTATLLALGLMGLAAASRKVR